MKKALTPSFESLYAKVKEILESARNRSYRAVNFEMVQAYWNIGRSIVEEEQAGREQAEYGKYLLSNLSYRLTTEYGKGFDYRNLAYMRQFYQTFPNMNALRSELSWTHYRILIRIEKEPAREFTYMYDNIIITRLDYYGKTEFYYEEKDSLNTGVIWAKYSGINDGFSGCLKFDDDGKVTLLVGDGYFQSKNLDTTRFKWNYVYAYNKPDIAENVCYIMLSTRYEQEFNNADSTGIIIDYKTKE